MFKFIKNGGKVKKYGLITALVSLLVGILPSFITGQNDHPVEELAEDLIKQGLCFGECGNLNIDLSPGDSGFFSENDSRPVLPQTPKVEESPDTQLDVSRKSENVSRETHLPKLPNPKEKVENPGDNLPEPERDFDK